MGWFWNFKQRFTQIHESVNERIFMQYARINPLEDFMPYGKYIIRAKLPILHDLANKLKPYLLTGELHAFKVSMRENATDSEFAGKLPILVVYVNKKEKESAPKLLATLGATELEWSQENLINNRF